MSLEIGSSVNETRNSTWPLHILPLQSSKSMYINVVPKFKNTRQSSCVSARGIPPTTYQVLHMLSYPRRGYFTPGGYTPPHLDLARVPPPCLDLAGVPPPPVWTWLGYPPPLDGHTPVKTLPFPILWMRVVKIVLGCCNVPFRTRA